VAARDYTTRRSQILAGLVTVLKGINGSGSFRMDLSNNVSKRLLFWDEVEDFPAVHLNAGSETRQYHGAGHKDRFLSVTLRCYVNAEDAVEELDKLLEDVETVLEANSRLSYFDLNGVTQYTQQITIVSIDTDEGVLEPLGVGEMLIEVRY
jgi:hypothetical protein|tara:strand:+ start:3306 stop:3758 length:453 start_codon:yes stop_codon:yes gene_type:complete